MKFNDKGFIFKFKDYTQVQIFSAGVAVLDMKIYEDKVCRSTFKCQDLATFNKENLSSTYPDNFLKALRPPIIEDRDHTIFYKWDSLYNPSDVFIAELSS